MNETLNEVLESISRSATAMEQKALASQPLTRDKLISLYTTYVGGNDYAARHDLFDAPSQRQVDEAMTSLEARFDRIVDTAPKEERDIGGAILLYLTVNGF
jgi:hypothetical protein